MDFSAMEYDGMHVYKFIFQLRHQTEPNEKARKALSFSILRSMI